MKLPIWGPTNTFQTITHPSASMKNCIFPFFLFFLLPFTPQSLYGQKADASFDPEAQRALRIMFYNLENAYDTIDAPSPGDDEFTPEGPRNWNAYKYRHKIKKLYKVMVAAGGWQPPDIIGICEVENHRVIEDLLYNTPLSKFPYRYVHRDSPDPRGMDVAALYNTRHFRLLSFRYFSPCPGGQQPPTRQILHISGATRHNDTLNLFFNHWPSKWKGAVLTQPQRNRAARSLREHIDSLQDYRPNARIIVAGDLNDPPGAESLTLYLKARKPGGKTIPGELYNLSYAWERSSTGTQKYRAKWEILDQILVTGNMLRDTSSLFTRTGCAHVFQPGFLLTEDEKYTGTKPSRTYSGYRYRGGFSDHLPVILDLHKPRKK